MSVSPRTEWSRSNSPILHHAIEGGEPSRAERIAEAETLKVDIVNKERKRLGDNNQAEWKRLPWSPARQACKTAATLDRAINDESPGVSRPIGGDTVRFERVLFPVSTCETN